MWLMRVLLLDEGFVSGALTGFGVKRAGCWVHVLACVGGTHRVQSRGSTWELAPRVGDPALLPLIRARSRGFDVVYPVTEPLQELATGVRHDKRRTSATMRAAGLLVPDEAELSDLGVFGFPVVLKGDTGRGGCNTFVIPNRAATRNLHFDSHYFLQRFIDGPTYLAGGLFDRGRALRLYMARKTVQFPARTGPAAELLSVDDQALRSAALHAFEVAGVTGIASADFIRDCDGRFHFLELNARPWGSMAAAAAAGVDLFAPLVSLWRGERVVPDLRFHAGVRTATSPLYLLSPGMWLTGRAFRPALNDLGDLVPFAWREPALAIHLAHRLLRMRVREEVRVVREERVQSIPRAEDDENPAGLHHCTAGGRVRAG